MTTNGTKGPATPALNFEREKDWADILLASRDMLHVQHLLSNVSPDPLGVYLASVAIIIAYCKPFTMSIRDGKRRVVGESWTGLFDADEIALHNKALDFRHSDHAHTDPYPGRVSIQVDKIAAGEEIRYSIRTSTRGLTMPELHTLALMVSKVRQAIELEKKALGELVLGDRVRAGYTGEFVLGENKA